MHFNKLVSDHASAPDHKIVKILNLLIRQAGDVVIGNFKMISDLRVQNMISDGPKYRFPSHIEFCKYKGEFVSASSVLVIEDAWGLMTLGSGK